MLWSLLFTSGAGVGGSEDDVVKVVDVVSEVLCTNDVDVDVDDDDDDDDVGDDDDVEDDEEEAPAVDKK